MSEFISLLPPSLANTARELEAAEAKCEAVVLADRPVRIKVNDACGNACHFCHNEGTAIARTGNAAQRSDPTQTVSPRAARQSIYVETGSPAFIPGDIHPDASYADALRWLEHHAQINEVHLTGGEPTLHKHINELVEIAASTVGEVKLTSNGERGAAGIAALGRAGLNSINFSIYGLSVPYFLQTQSPGFSERAAARRIAAVQEAIAATRDAGMQPKANVVIGGLSDAGRLHEALAMLDPDIDLRFQPEASQQQLGATVIRALLSGYGATPVGTIMHTGSSNQAVVYELPNQRRVSLKTFRHSRLPSVCDGCPIDAAGNCQEGYYGPRLYREKLGQLVLGLCVQRVNDLAVSMPDMKEDLAFNRDSSLVDRLRLQPWHDAAHDIPRDGRTVRRLYITDDDFFDAVVLHDVGGPMFASVNGNALCSWNGDVGTIYQIANSMRRDNDGRVGVPTHKTTVWRL